MRKGIKVTLSVLAIILLVLVVGFISLVIFVNPDRFKPLIVAKVKQYTGRDLVIEGHLSWSLYPYFGVKVGQLKLNNPSGFSNPVFAELDSMTVGVKLLPLLHSRIESNGIALQGLKLHLIKNAEGRTNWTFAPASAAKKASTPAQADRNTVAPFALALEGLKITDASVDWQNEKTHARFVVDKLNATSQKITFDKPFPVNMNFHFNNGKTQGTAKLSSEVNFRAIADRPYVSFNQLQLSVDFTQGAAHHTLNLKTDLTIRWGIAEATIAALSGRFDDIPFTGNMVVHHFSSPIEAITAGGALQSPLVKLNQFSMKDWRTVIQLQNGLLTFAPITATLYNGYLNGKMTVNIKSAVPSISSQMTLSQLQLKPLLTDLGSQGLRVSGTGNVELSITASGTDKSSLLQTLNGQGSVKVNQGTLEGIDIHYLAQTAFSLAKGQSVSASGNTNQTPFGNLSASFMINHGVIANQDLLVDMPAYTTKGHGTIDLVRQQINYNLATSVKRDYESKLDVSNLYGIAVPIQISGNLQHPSIGLNMADLTKQIAELQLNRARDQVKSKVEQKIKSLTNGNELIQNLLSR